MDHVTNGAGLDDEDALGIGHAEIVTCCLPLVTCRLSVVIDVSQES
jgi:hypothetical protein